MPATLSVEHAGNRRFQQMQAQSEPALQLTLGYLQINLVLPVILATQFQTSPFHGQTQQSLQQ